MAVLSKGTTFATNQQVAAPAFNNLADNATFASGAVDSTTTTLSGGAIVVKDGGITPTKLSTGGPSWDTSGNVTTTGDVAVGDDLTVTGQATISELLDVSGSAAGQIKFPAIQNASSDANTLDDYEEGTWTPSLGGTATYTARTGIYTKIGRQVNIVGYIAVNSIGSGSTYAVTGLPFTPSSLVNEWAGYVSSWNSTASSFVSMSCRALASGNLEFVGTTSAATTSPTAPNAFGSGTYIYFGCTYYV